MEQTAKRLVAHWVQKGILDESEAEWCVYGLLSRITTASTLSVVVILGAIVSNFLYALVFTTAFLFLRVRTNGHHAKTYLACLFHSILIEIGSLILVPFLRLPFALLLVGLSNLIIISLAPANNDSIHLTVEEVAALRPRILIRLATVDLTYILLLLIDSLFANCIVFALIADATLLALASPGKT